MHEVYSDLRQYEVALEEKNAALEALQTGKLMGFVVTDRPVGELRLASQALRQAHELNNLISFMLGKILSRQRDSQRLESYLTAVHTNDVAEAPLSRAYLSHFSPPSQSARLRDWACRSATASLIAMAAN